MSTISPEDGAFLPFIQSFQQFQTFSHYFQLFTSCSQILVFTLYCLKTISFISPASPGFPLLLANYFSNLSISPLLANYFTIKPEFVQQCCCVFFQIIGSTTQFFTNLPATAGPPLHYLGWEPLLDSAFGHWPRILIYPVVNNFLHPAALHEHLSRPLGAFLRSFKGFIGDNSNTRRRERAQQDIDASGFLFCNGQRHFSSCFFPEGAMTSNIRQLQPTRTHINTCRGTNNVMKN